MFAHLNDDVLFGEVWNEEAIDVKTKCIITVVSLMASGITDSSLTYHLQNAKAHGVTKDEIAAIITHATMYVGWPKGWAVFRQAKDVWNEEAPERTEKGVAEWLGQSEWQVKRNVLPAMRNYSGVKVMQIIGEIRRTDARSKGVDNPSTPPGELMKELLFFILH
jgi:alkylhydroperoxidase/carboxymuconolactone decarboxylase family protein YurZ